MLSRNDLFRALGVCCVVVGLHAEENRIGDARGQARAAEDFIRTTHFFSNGHGLHTAAIPAKPFDLLGRAGVERFKDALSQSGFIDDGDEVVGFFWTRSDEGVVGAVGCVACHAGRAAGRTYVGLGNKTIDVAQVGRLVHAGALAVQGLGGNARRRRLNDSAARLGLRLADERWTNQTRGLVPTALIFRWFYEQAGQKFPADFPRGAVKIPALWGYSEKMHAGLFVDGFADGTALGWSAMVELAGGQTYAGYLTYRDQLKELKRQFAHLLPPEYPYEVDEVQAAAGARIFKENCSVCHGEYRRDADGLPRSEPPRLVPWSDVGTDFDRLKYRESALPQLIDAGSWRDDFKYHDQEPGYFAPRLEGVWARFPYLHNGSVPHLRALLTEPARRPTVWSLENAGEADRFDEADVGLTLPVPKSAEAKELQRRAVEGSRAVYHTTRIGHSNAGHEFGTDFSDDDKTALIEYLKTL